MEQFRFHAFKASILTVIVGYGFRFSVKSRLLYLEATGFTENRAHYLIVLGGLVVIWEIDGPFQGDVVVSPEAFEQTLEIYRELPSG